MTLLFATSKILLVCCYLHSPAPVPHRRYCYCYSHDHITKHNVKRLLGNHFTCYRFIATKGGFIVHIPFRLIVGAVFYCSMSRNDDRANNEAKQIISQEIDNVNTNPSIVKVNGCAACHVLFSIVDKMHVNESEASDLLSQILYLENYS